MLERCTACGAVVEHLSDASLQRLEGPVGRGGGRRHRRCLLRSAEPTKAASIFVNACCGSALCRDVCPEGLDPYDMMRLAKVRQARWTRRSRRRATTISGWSRRRRSLARSSRAGSHSPPAARRPSLPSRLLHGLQHHADPAHRPDGDGTCSTCSASTTPPSAAAPTAAASSSSASAGQPPPRRSPGTPSTTSPRSSRAKSSPGARPASSTSPTSARTTSTTTFRSTTSATSCSSGWTSSAAAPAAADARRPGSPRAAAPRRLGHRGPDHAPGRHPEPWRWCRTEQHVYGYQCNAISASGALEAALERMLAETGAPGRRRPGLGLPRLPPPPVQRPAPAASRSRWSTGSACSPGRWATSAKTATAPTRCSATRTRSSKKRWPSTGARASRWRPAQGDPWEFGG